VSVGFLSAVGGNNRAVLKEVQKPCMADAKDTGDRPPPQGEKSALQGQPDAHAARNAGVQDVKAAEAIRTNQSDGSLRKFAALADQELSIELCYEGQVASRTQNKSEKELLAQVPKEALIEQSKTLQELESAAKIDPVAEVLLGFRRQAEGMKPGPDKERLTNLAKEQAAEHLSTRAIDDQESCGVHEMPSERKAPLSGHVQYPEKEIEGIKRLTPEDLSKLAKAMEAGGPAAEASLKQTSDEILRRTGESYKDTVLCGINAIVGLLQYDRDLVFNPEKAREQAAGAGEVLGLLMYSGAVGSIKLGGYAETIRQSGDYSLPLKHIPQMLNKWYESQSPADQMAIIAGVTGGLHLNQSMKEMAKLKQPGAFSVFLQEAIEALPRNPEAERRAMELMGALVKRAQPVTERAGAATGKITDVVQEAQDKGIKDHIMEMVRYFEHGKKKSVTGEYAAGKAGVTKKELATLTDAQLEVLRLERIAEGYRTAFYKAYPNLKNAGLEVHHALPQTLLDSHPGLFKAKEIHSLKYLSGIPETATHNGEGVHKLITQSWTKFLKYNDSPSRKQVLEHLSKLDAEYGRYFVPPLTKGVR